MNVEFAYDHPTSLISSMADSALDFAANMRRMPVAFQGRVKEPVMLRQLMTAVHEVVMSDYRTSQAGLFMLDPVITVHPDQLFFEAFSTDESAYVRLSAPRDAFEIEKQPTYGTTNIDFTWKLREALQDLRTSRRTEFTVGAGGFGVNTQVNSREKTHFERKVDLPESWVKGFLQVQSALAMKAFTFDVRPADLLTVISYFQERKERNWSNSLRYDFRPGEAISIQLDPWPYRFMLKGTAYAGYPRVVRVWGRQRLELLQRVLPYAQKATIGVLGRGLPHYYICHCGAYEFTLVLSGWSRNDWSKGSAFDLLAPRRAMDAETVATVYNFLAQRYAAPVDEIAAHTLLPDSTVEQALFELCRAGRVIVDPISRVYRSRELFAEPLDMATLFAPDPRLDQAQALVAHGAVTLLSAGKSETRKREMRAEALVADDDTEYNTVVAVDEEWSIRFAQCGCKFFRDNIMSRGPCRHILATRMVFEDRVKVDEEKSLSV